MAGKGIRFSDAKEGAGHSVSLGRRLARLEAKEQGSNCSVQEIGL